jgi:hypothetical protein
MFDYPGALVEFGVRTATVPSVSSTGGQSGEEEDDLAAFCVDGVYEALREIRSFCSGQGAEGGGWKVDE